MSALSEVELDSIWDKLRRSLTGVASTEVSPNKRSGGVPESMWAGELAVEALKSMPDLFNLFKDTLVHGEAYNQEQADKYQVPLRTGERDTSASQAVRSALDFVGVPEDYQSTTLGAQAIKEAGSKLFNPVSEMFSSVAGWGQPDVSDEPNPWGARADSFISLMGPAALTRQVGRAVTGPTAGKASGNTQIALAQQADNYRRTYGLEPRNLLMDKVREVGQDKFSQLPSAITAINDRRDVTSEVGLLNTQMEKRKSGQPTGRWKIPSWYSTPTAKFQHLLDMGFVALTKRSEAKGVLKEMNEEFTPSVMAEIDKLMDGIPRVWDRQKGGQVNKTLDQMTHVLLAHQMHDPFGERTKWLEGRLPLLLPEKVPVMNKSDFSTAHVQELMGEHFSGALSSKVVLDEHITPYLKSGHVSRLGEEGGLIYAQTKPMFNLSNVKSEMRKDSAITPKSWKADGLFSWRGKLPVVLDSHNILVEWHNMHPDHRPAFTKEYLAGELVKKDAELEKAFHANMKDWKASENAFLPSAQKVLSSGGISTKLGTAGRYAEWKARKPVLRTYGSDPYLSRNIKVGNGYLSVGQEFLSSDTLLATMTGRGIWSLSDPQNGAIIAMDTYQQGAGGLIDTALNIGSNQMTMVLTDALHWNRAHSQGLKDGNMLKNMGDKSGSSVVASITSKGDYRELGETLLGKPFITRKEFRKSVMQ